MQSNSGMRRWEVYSHRHLLKHLFISSWQHTVINFCKAQPGADSLPPSLLSILQAQKDTACGESCW